MQRNSIPVGVSSPRYGVTHKRVGVFWNSEVKDVSRTKRAYTRVNRFCWYYCISNCAKTTADWMEQNGKGQLNVNILVPVPVHGSTEQ